MFGLGAREDGLMEPRLTGEQDVKKLKRLGAEDCPVGEKSMCKSPGVREIEGVGLCGCRRGIKEKRGVGMSRAEGLTPQDLELQGEWVLFCFAFPNLGSKAFFVPWALFFFASQV